MGINRGINTWNNTIPDLRLVPQFRGDWASVPYELADLVLHHNSVYIATAPTTTFDEPGKSSKWNRWIDGTLIPVTLENVNSRLAELDNNIAFVGTQLRTAQGIIESAVTTKDQLAVEFKKTENELRSIVGIKSIGRLPQPGDEPGTYRFNNQDITWDGNDIISTTPVLALASDSAHSVENFLALGGVAEIANRVFTLTGDYVKEIKPKLLSRDSQFQELNQSTIVPLMSTGSFANNWVRGGGTFDATHTFSIDNTGITFDNKTDIGPQFLQVITGWSVGSKLRLTIKASPFTSKDDGYIATTLNFQDKNRQPIPGGELFIPGGRTPEASAECIVPEGTDFVFVSIMPVNDIKVTIKSVTVEVIHNPGQIAQVGNSYFVNSKRHVKDFGASGSSYKTIGTIATNSNILKLTEVGDWKDGQNIAIQGAGKPCELVAPTNATATYYGSVTGNRTIRLRVAALEKGGAVSPASQEVTVDKLPDRFTPQNYVKLSWDAVPNANGYGVYLDDKLIDVVTTPYSRICVNYKRFGNLNVPDTILPGGQAGILLTKIGSGAGTKQLTLVNTAITASTGQVIHDDTEAFQKAVDSTPINGELDVSCDDMYRLGTIRFSHPVFLVGTHKVVPMPTLGKEDSVYVYMDKQVSASESYRGDGVKSYGGIERVFFGDRKEYRTVPIFAALHLPYGDWINIQDVNGWGLLGSGVAIGEIRECVFGAFRFTHCGDGDRAAVVDIYSAPVNIDQPNIIQWTHLQTIYSYGISIRTKGQKLSDPNGGYAVRMVYIYNVQIEGCHDQWLDEGVIDWNGVALDRYDHSIKFISGSIAHQSGMVDGKLRNAAGVSFGDGQGRAIGQVEFISVLNFSTICFALNGAKASDGDVRKNAVVINGGFVSATSFGGIPKADIVFGKLVRGGDNQITVEPSTTQNSHVFVTGGVDIGDGLTVLGDDGSKVVYDVRYFKPVKIDPYTPGSIIKNTWGVPISVTLVIAPHPTPSQIYMVTAYVDDLSNGDWDYLARGSGPGTTTGWTGVETTMNFVIPRGASFKIESDTKNVAFGKVIIRPVT